MSCKRRKKLSQKQRELKLQQTVDLSAWKSLTDVSQSPSSGRKDAAPFVPPLDATLERISKELAETSVALSVIIQHVKDLESRMAEGEKHIRILTRILASIGKPAAAP